MKIEQFISGQEVKQPEGYTAFIPNEINHEFSWDNPELTILLESATLRLGELNAFSRLVPDLSTFIRMHILKEATFSSKIEGTQTTLEEAFLKELSVEPERRDDWREVHNYNRAMDYALDNLKNVPLSSRLIKECHRILLEGVRGAHKSPGEFRRSQNWIGGLAIKDAVFIPPPAHQVEHLMGDLENFIHNQTNVPYLIRIAIAHYQFETIHPFLDGNGRLGRLMVPLYLVSQNVLLNPVLYLSEILERDKRLYYDNLTIVREENNLTQWLKYFLVAMDEVSQKSSTCLEDVLRLKDNCETKILSLGRRIPNAKKLLNALWRNPVVDSSDVVSILGTTPKTAYNVVADFEELAILREETGFARNRYFVFRDYLNLFQ